MITTRLIKLRHIKEYNYLFKEAKTNGNAKNMICDKIIKKFNIDWLVRKLLSNIRICFLIPEIKR